MVKRKKNNNSFFIAMEGLDGSGTSTQVDLLGAYLRNETNRKILITKEPTNNIVGGLVRGCLIGDWKTTHAGLQLLFAADRAHHLEKEIIPALNEGYIVVADRYYLSSIAYGSVNVDRDWLYKINELFPKPDITFIMDVKPRTATKRMLKSRYTVELFEHLKTLEKVRNNYLREAKSMKNIFVINGEEIITRVRDDVNKIARKYIKVNRH